MRTTTHNGEETTAYFLNVWAEHPIYHAYGRISGDQDLTQCGIVLYPRPMRLPVHMPIEHAEKFGEPCKRCFV